MASYARGLLRFTPKADIVVSRYVRLTGQRPVVSLINPSIVSRTFSGASDSDFEKQKKEMEEMMKESEQSDKFKKNLEAGYGTDFEVDYLDEDDFADEKRKVKAARAKVGDIDPSQYTKEVKLLMPNMDDDGSGGKVVYWHKRQGDLVLRNDLLCDIEVKEFSFTMQNEDEFPSFMGEIFQPASDKILPHGEPLCAMMHKESNLKSADKSK
eukprot:CAMPEP_0172463254 /NCGR_PEP_ID=MMETSP1065-20121228/46528_1 /TAXON_ID=265537 /ORGANISM="Amphiprora paludosa, Strain CCMP125" /LENGTH=210 /DNA_ID=CAMNT_0013219157 /DNA_START=15 /DNA_END=647 /DNA_ORIENTATION=+